MKSILRLSFYFLFALTNIISFAQISTREINNDSTIQKTDMKNTVYAEILGNAAGLSITHDRIVFRKNNISLSLCLGVGMVPSNLINGALNNGVKPNYLVYGIPISTNLFWGRKNNHLETGLGLTYQQGMTGIGEKYSKTIFAVARIGYRYQKEGGGFFWKIGLTPFFAIADFGVIKSIPIVPLAGIALGYTIK